jgi:hypothetical protein
MCGRGSIQSRIKFERLDTGRTPQRVHTIKHAKLNDGGIVGVNPVNRRQWQAIRPKPLTTSRITRSQTESCQA